MNSVLAFGRHVTTLFVEPSRAFRVDATRALPPLLMLVLLTMGIASLHATAIPVETRVDAQIAQTESILGRRLSQAEREARYLDAQSTARFVTKAVVYGVSTALALLTTAFVFLTVAVISGSTVRYRTMVGVVGDAMLPPSLVWTVCTAVVLFLKSPADIDPIRFDAIVVSSLGALLDRQSWSPFVVSLCSSLDVFSLWTAALIATGLAIGAPRMGGRAAITTTIGVWGSYVLLKAVAALWLPQLA